ncbi:hypothetical protein [Microbacterium yannicii]|uniref:hypothetical protein n=1 Tax=Microbacterium yannicii TaxID=671622 RepID=UPI000367D364|nr:hypothetical protein [Microbacterium yannicii]
MTVWICQTCAIEHADTEQPPVICEICVDDRQWVPVAGQQWTHREQLRQLGYRTRIDELEPGLHGITVSPKLGIGQRGLLLCTEGGNLLFDPPGYIDQEAIDVVRDLGGVAVIASSHPHLTGASIQWSHAFGGVDVLVADADREWVRRPDPVIRFWRDETELLPGVRIVQCGGHFPGSSVVDWQGGADGRGVLLTGDTLMVNPDHKTIAVMWSFVNRVPLSQTAIRGIQFAIQPLQYDRIYDGWDALGTGARSRVTASLERYLAVETARQVPPVAVPTPSC